MIEFRRGNLLEADAEALVNTVNCVGVMGKGVALQFRQAFPENFRAYERACARGEVRLGQMFVHATGRLTNPRFIINFPTKQHWKARSRLPDIRTGLVDLTETAKRLQITSIAVPPLGCGNGGLNWDDVYPLIDAAFSVLPHVQVMVYPPQTVPGAADMPVSTNRPKLTRARALLVLLVDRYREPGYRLTKLEVQKLAYFLQEAGESLRLHFTKHTLGPYAEKLNHALRDMEGHFLRGFGDRTADASIRATPEAVEQARQFLREDQEARDRLELVANLISGFENPYGMELLASVHWAAKEDASAALDPAAAVQRVHEWSQRKRQTFRPEHIAKAWHRLSDQHWLPKT